MSPCKDIFLLDINFQVHMFFSMMNMGRAYVTATGRLIGVVGLKELRDSITNADAIMEAKRQKKLDLEKEQQDLGRIV